jgi:hypothetical protein
VGDPNATVADAFLREVATELRRLGWRLRRVLTDGGSEFKGQFDRARHALGIRLYDHDRPRTQGRTPAAIVKGRARRGRLAGSRAYSTLSAPPRSLA